MDEPSGAPPATVSRRITAGEIASAILVLIVVAACWRLCIWQLHRLRDRRASNASIAARMTAPPVPGFAGMTDTAGSLYRRIEIHGTYDDARTIILPARSFDGSPGVHLLTPALLSDGTAVLVNRGWVPSADAATVDLRLVPSVNTPQIVGLALPFPDRHASVSRTGDSTVAPGSFRRVWYTINEAALRSQFPYHLAPFVLQILPSEGARGFPKPIPPPSLDEGPHLSYAIQWFSFGTIAIVGWITFMIRRRAERKGTRRVIAPPHPPRL